MEGIHVDSNGLIKSNCICLFHPLRDVHCSIAADLMFNMICAYWKDEQHFSVEDYHCFLILEIRSMMNCYHLSLADEFLSSVDT